jgi:WD40-like Beta Propeller Repeat
VIGLILLVGLAGAPAAHATFSGGNGRIAFDIRGTTPDDQGRPERYRALATVRLNVGLAGGVRDAFLRSCVVAGNGLGMGDCTIDYRAPAWSPNGRRLAFDAGTSLALVRSDHSGFRKLRAYTSNDGEPAWSRSGTRLAFTGRSGSRTDIFIASPGSRAKRRLASRAASPDWSSRDRIAFERGGSIYTIKPDGSDLQRIARGKDPSWSASGRSIAFARGGSIYMIGADGEKLRRIVRCSNCATPAFSPNGKMVVYDRRGLEVARVRDGRRLAQLISDVRGGSGSVENSNPDWQSR